MQTGERKHQSKLFTATQRTKHANGLHFPDTLRRFPDSTLSSWSCWWPGIGPGFATTLQHMLEDDVAISQIVQLKRRSTFGQLQVVDVLLQAILTGIGLGADMATRTKLLNV